MVFVALSCASGQVKVYTDQLIADSITFNRTDWVNEWSKDGTFGGNSDRAVPTEKAVVTYVAAQIAAITVGVTDTAEVIRLIGAYLDTVNISFTANYDAVGDTLLTYFNGDFGYALSFKSIHQDSLNVHTDTLQLHNVRIKAIKDTVISHNTRIKSNFASIVSKQDSINKHTDTLQLHNVRLKSLETGGSGGIVDTAGLPKANRVAYFTNANTIGTNNSLVYHPNDTFFVDINAGGSLSIIDNGYVGIASSGYLELNADDSVIVSRNLHLNDTLRLNYMGLAAGDTVALLAIGAKESVDSASLVPAARAWDDNLEPFLIFYQKSLTMKSLPLPFPNGNERRRPNAKYMAYQFEYELERSTRYMKELYDRVGKLESENNMLIKKPKRKDFNKLMLRIDSLERRVENLEKMVLK